MASSLAALLHPQITGIPNGVGVSAAELPYAAGAPVANTVTRPLTNDLFSAIYQRGPYAGLRGVLKGMGQPLGLPAAGQTFTAPPVNPRLTELLNTIDAQGAELAAGRIPNFGPGSVVNPTVNGVNLFAEGATPMQGGFTAASGAAGGVAPEAAQATVHPITEALSSQVAALSAPVTPNIGSISGVTTPPTVGPYSTFPGVAGDIPNMVTSAPRVAGEFSAFPGAATAAAPAAPAAAELAAESAAPSLAQRLLPTLSAARAGEGSGIIGRLAGGGRLARGAGGLAAGVGLHAAGTALGGSGSNGSLAGQLVGGASTGAGIGGGVAGLPGGIVGGLGTGIANVATGGGFEDMLNDWLGKGPADKFKAETDPNVYAIMQSLNNPADDTFGQLGIAPDTAQGIKDQFIAAITNDNGEVTTDQETRIKALQHAAQSAFDAAQGTATTANTAASTTPSMSPTDIAALQIMASQLFAPIAADQQQIGAMQGAALQNLAPSLPGPYQDVIGHMAQTARTNGDRSANALIQQAYAIPQVNALDQYQQYLNQASGQLVSSALGGQLQGGGGGGLSDLLGSLGGAAGTGGAGEVNPDSAALIAQITGQ